MKRLSLIAVVTFFVCVGAWAQGPTLTGQVDSMGFDLNSNGLIDLLQVKVGIANAGFIYYGSVTLTDKNGTVLAQQSEMGIPVIAGVMYFYFDGSVIGANGVNGPYYLALTLKDALGPSGNVVLTASGLATDAFNADQFEGFTGSSDTTPPTVTVAATPAVLWPVDHKMHEIQLDVVATDDTDPNPVISLLGITSNQGENLTGDGNTSPDILVQDGRIFLRAERNAHSTTDRIYTITYTATDASGNIGTGFATVSVPHDHRSE
jgi:hypothetical protein